MSEHTSGVRYTSSAVTLIISVVCFCYIRAEYIMRVHLLHTYVGTVYIYVHSLIRALFLQAAEILWKTDSFPYRYVHICSYVLL